MLAFVVYVLCVFVFVDVWCSLYVLVLHMYTRLHRRFNFCLHPSMCISSEYFCVYDMFVHVY